MRFKRLFCMVLACATAVGCLSMGAGAVEVAEQETSAIVMRATNRFSLDIPGETLAETETSFPLAAGETITISATYTPRSASVDFGFIAPDGLFYSVGGESGSVDKTIQVSQRGDYTLAIRNNSSNTISVSGFVNY
ncbi:MAG: hypothetical protein Q4C45_01160 [Oscillospiraceae bacterium]|nr:hypothetical protein [Oscillospiraceae bacterium]